MPDLHEDKIYAVFANAANQKIIRDIEMSGAKVLRLPEFETRRIHVENLSVESLKVFDWLIFTDVLAVRFFLETLSENQIDFYELDEMRVCALGEVVSDELRFVQIHSDVIPSFIAADAVFAALIDYIGAADLSRAEFLIIGDFGVGEDLEKLLIEAQAECEQLKIYQSIVADEYETAKIKSLFKGGAVDEFVVMSAEDLAALAAIFAGEKIVTVLREVKCSAASPSVLQYLRENYLTDVSFFRITDLLK